MKSINNIEWKADKQRKVIFKSGSTIWVTDKFANEIVDRIILEECNLFVKEGGEVLYIDLREIECIN